MRANTEPNKGMQASAHIVCSYLVLSESSFRSSAHKPPIFLTLGGLALRIHRADDHRVLLTSVP
jgi:hypothetical protein